MIVESLEKRLLFAAAPDVVIEWNNVLIDALRADRTLPGPGWSSRSAAMVHAAIYDAINAISGRYEPFLVDRRAPKWIPATAAAAAAGWRVLSEIYPAQQDMLDDALATSLARVQNDRREAAGVALGIEVADAILASRQGDGSAIDPPYVPGTGPGDWQPAPPMLGGALGAGWGSVEPFAIESGAQFRPPPVPAMDSDAYTDAFNEVKSLGEKDSATRTPEQTEIGLFWAYDRPGTGTPPVLYNQIVQTIAKQKHNTTLENARLFALANLAQADAGIAAWDCKYVENFWRPITGIRAGDADGNDATDGDPTWEPLGAPGNGADIPNFTPPFPAYVSGHATFGAAVFQVLRDFYGTDDIAFTIGSDELPGVTRSFESFSQASAENGISRIYLGIHWSFDNTAGQQLGEEVAEYTFDKMLRPVKGRKDVASKRGDVMFARSASLFSATRVVLSDGRGVDDLNREIT